MTSTIASTLGRLVAGVGLLLVLTLPSTGALVSATLVVAVLAIVAMTVARSMPPLAGGTAPAVRARALVDRMVPRTAQTDPGARGHRRPRAPGFLLPAV